MIYKIPLKLKSAYKDYIWGGEKLRSIYGKETNISSLAESWELSCHPDELSIIDGGEHEGKTLESYIKDMTENELKKAIEDNSVEALLNTVPSKKEMYFLMKLELSTLLAKEMSLPRFSRTAMLPTVFMTTAE